ncbi:MAG TPA: SMC family ATPase [Mycobacteriales bacterium]|nr:SMC family ATPase [Mycobacteriales bacterium]
MRPHALRLTAFGAFATTVDVDLDRLAEAGLFLLHGPTGAGKTTLLDGLGFALFGRVPGARQGAKRLRSDHAEDALRTEVQAEVSFGTRRFRVTRSPEQVRAKRRGTGTTTEPAKVCLEELVDGAWSTRSTRVGEADQEIADLVGMSAEQFFQVVLLPQGEFAQFLRADSVKRAEVLQKLFATERFRDAEQWLAARRRTCAEAVAAAQDQVDLLVARVAEAAGAEPAETEPAETEPVTWAEALLAAGQREEARVAQAVSTATAARDGARTELEEAQDLAERQRRRTVALQRREHLELARPSLVALQQEADAAARAAEVAGALGEVVTRRTRRDVALSAEAVARSGLLAVGLAADLDEPELTGLVSACRERSGRLEALRAVEGSLLEELAAVAAARDEQARALTEVAELEVELASLPLRAEQASTLMRSGREAAELRPALVAEQRRLEALRPDVVSLVQVETRLLHRIEEHLAARQAHVSLLEKANDLRTASINTMVARLAFALQDHTPCPVCGALEHPDPSALRDEGVSTEDEDAARRAADDAALVVAEVDAALAADRATAASLRERVDGLTPAGVDVQLSELAVELAVLDVAASEGRRAELDAAGVEEATRTALSAHVAASARVEASERAAEGAGRRALAAEAQLRDALGGAATLDEAVAAAAAQSTAAQAALTATQALVTAQQELDAAQRAAESTCLAKGFASPDDAREAARPEPWRAGTATHLRSAADTEAAVLAELADPALDVPLDPPAPVEARVEELVAADLGLSEVTAEHAKAMSRRTALERLVPSLVGAVAVLSPLTETATAVRRLADLCAGQGQNALRMTLSAFVLAARLEEVAEAASVRLRRMTQGRYELVHTDGAARGGVRAGLGLLARDAWSGQDRDTATLSGGETFLASLALALGLADVVMAEAGGARIEALFVDEGFGTLDEETLDEVMDVLDGLREGGRVVGLVSHVTELRQRIPAQVEVRRTRTGSDVVLHGC